MAATGFSPHKSSLDEKIALESKRVDRQNSDEENVAPYSPPSPDESKVRYDHTHRKLKPRHIQLIGIGG